MGTTNIVNTILNFIWCLAWKIYVKTKWRKNLVIKNILLKEEIRDNLWHFLTYWHTNFEKFKIK